MYRKRLHLRTLSRRKSLLLRHRHSIEMECTLFSQNKKRSVWKPCRKSLPLRPVICRKSLLFKDQKLICFCVSVYFFRVFGEILSRGRTNPKHTFSNPPISCTVFSIIPLATLEPRVYLLKTSWRW